MLFINILGFVVKDHIHIWQLSKILFHLIVPLSIRMTEYWEFYLGRKCRVSQQIHATPHHNIRVRFGMALQREVRYRGVIRQQNQMSTYMKHGFVWNGEYRRDVDKSFMRRKFGEVDSCIHRLAWYRRTSGDSLEEVNTVINLDTVYFHPLEPWNFFMGHTKSIKLHTKASSWALWIAGIHWKLEK